MKAIIADDEPVLRSELRRQLTTLWPQLEIVAEAENGLEAVDVIRKYRPDIAFLDIRMPGLDGLQVAQTIGTACHVVFVTAYDRYAVAAFEHNAVDYLLKPMNSERLRATVHRLQNRQSTADPQLLYEMLVKLHHTQPETNKLRWISAAKGENIIMVNVNDIVYFRSDYKYTTVATDNDEYLIRTSLKQLEEKLDSTQFWRIHRSFIVNVNRIEKATRTLDGRCQIKLKGCNEKIVASRTYAHLFKQM